MLRSDWTTPRNIGSAILPWQPIPFSSQWLAWVCPADHILYCGSRGPGKTDVQLMRFVRRCGKGYGKFWRGVIFDREYKNLDDLVAKSKRWFPNLGRNAPEFRASQGDYKWVWETGEELLFRVVKKDRDYWSYHGHEYPFIGWNELTKFPTSELYDLMMSTNRSSFTPDKDSPNYLAEWAPDGTGRVLADRANGILIPPIPLEVFSTANPWGAGHTWVKRRFVTPAPYGELQKQGVEVFDPQLQKNRVVTRTQTAIFGTYKENIYLDAKYVSSLVEQTDPNIRKAWLQGSWDIVAGGALSDVWETATHVIPRFQVPRAWKLDRALDWGSSHPAGVLWFAECDGTEAILPDGRRFGPPKGTIVVISELYATIQLGTNKGLKWSATTLAQKVKEHEVGLFEKAWILDWPAPGPADNQIADVRESDVETIEFKMAREGVRWLESNKGKGTRTSGLQVIRDRLEASIKKEKPGLYFMDNCRAALDTIPSLPRDPDNLDDVDTSAEDHLYDCLRYRVLKGTNRIASGFQLKFA